MFSWSAMFASGGCVGGDGVGVRAVGGGIGSNSATSANGIIMMDYGSYERDVYGPTQDIFVRFEDLYNQFIEFVHMMPFFNIEIGFCIFFLYTLKRIDE